MPPDEGLRPPQRPPAARPPVGAARSSRSAPTAASRRSGWVPPPGAAARVLFALDHHRGSEENQPGWEYHDADLVDPAGRHGHPAPFRRTVSTPGWRRRRGPGRRLAHRRPVLGEPLGVPVHRRRPRLRAGSPRLRAVDPARRARRHLAIHDVFPDPADGGRPPYEIYRRALESGSVPRSNAPPPSLRVLERA